MCCLGAQVFQVQFFFYIYAVEFFKLVVDHLHLMQKSISKYNSGTKNRFVQKNLVNDLSVLDVSLFTHQIS